MADMQASQVQTNAEAYAATQSEGQFSTLIPDAATIAFLNAVPGGLAQSVFNLHQTLHAAALVDSQRQLDPLLLQTYPGISEIYDTNIRQFRYTTTHRSKADKQNGTVYSLSDDIPEPQNIVGDWFLDSLGGNDSNNGKNSSSPIKTYSRLSQLGVSAGEKILIRYGSKFSEFFDFIGIDNLTIASYGDSSDGLPKITAADVIGSWTASGTQNVYETTITLPSIAEGGETSKMNITAYEGDELLLRVSDLATCGSTPGSFFVDTINAPGTSQAVYIHTVDSSNPSTNGNTYEVSTRSRAIRLGDSCTVSDLLTEKQVHNNGSFEAGDYATIDRCIFKDGHVHNMLVGAGSVISDCWAYGFDGASGITSVAFVGYSTSNLGADITFNRCIAINRQDTLFDNVNGFYVHGQGEDDFGVVTYNQCEGYYVGSLHSGAAENTELATNQCLAYECARFGKNGGSPSYTSTEDEYYRETALSGVIDVAIGGSIGAFDRFKAYMNGGDFVKTDNTSTPIDMTVTNSVAAIDPANRGSAIILEAPSGGRTVSFESQDNVFMDWKGFGTNLFNLDNDITDTSGIILDSNVIQDEATRNRIGFTDYTNMTDFRAAHPQYEPNSVVVTSAGIISPSERNYTQSPGGAAELNGAGNVGSHQNASTYASRLSQVEGLTS